MDFILNGRPVSVEAEPGTSLLELLRERLGLRSMKDGCAPEGTCGACTVLVDGRPVVSCARDAARCAGREVVTLEGLPPDVRATWADAFVETGASQCGFCSPGIVMKAEGLLRREAAPTRDEIAHALAGNLCRCTGYIKVVDAIERVAAERQPRLERYRRQLERLGYRVIGLPELRVDSERRTVGLGNMDFTSCNALPASRRGRPAVFYLPWGIRALDALAARQWRAAGVQPVALSAFAPLAHGMMELAAGLHCFVGPLPTRRRSR